MDFSEAIDEIPEMLSEHLQLEVQQVLEQRKQEGGGADQASDLVVVLDGLKFDIEYKHRSRAEQVGQAVRSVREPDRQASDSIPLVVVPYMGDIGRKLCEDAQVPWMDLSGNAWIHSGTIRVSVLGRENKFKGRGRKPNLFAPKSARIVRILLVDYDRSYFQKELAELADVDPGHVSRLVRRLEEVGFIERDLSSGVAVREPDLLLDAWTDEYDLDDHSVMKGHLSVQSPEEALDRLDEILQRGRVTYALTGLPAAWLYVRHATYRLTTVFVDSWPERPRLEEAGWRDEERGANVWLLKPNDPGVFYGSVAQAGHRCVSSVQTYLDLCQLPERATEAAEVLRRERLTWRENDE